MTNLRVEAWLRSLRVDAWLRSLHVDARAIATRTAHQETGLSPKRHRRRRPRRVAWRCGYGDGEGRWRHIERFEFAHVHPERVEVAINEHLDVPVRATKDYGARGSNTATGLSVRIRCGHGWFQRPLCVLGSRISNTKSLCMLPSFLLRLSYSTCVFSQEIFWLFRYFVLSFFWSFRSFVLPFFLTL